MKLKGLKKYLYMYKLIILMLITILTIILYFYKESVVFLPLIFLFIIEILDYYDKRRNQIPSSFKIFNTKSAPSTEEEK